MIGFNFNFWFSKPQPRGLVQECVYRVKKKYNEDKFMFFGSILSYVLLVYIILYEKDPEKRWKFWTDHRLMNLESKINKKN